MLLTDCEGTLIDSWNIHWLVNESIVIDPCLCLLLRTLTWILKMVLWKRKLLLRISSFVRNLFFQISGLTLHGTNISHLGKRKNIDSIGDMLVPRRVVLIRIPSLPCHWDFVPLPITDLGYIYYCTNYSEDRRGNEVGKVELARTGPRWKNWK